MVESRERVTSKRRNNKTALKFNLELSKEREREKFVYHKSKKKTKMCNFHILHMMRLI